MNTAMIAAISALIGAIFGGIGLIIEKLFTANQNKALQYSHEEKLIELVGKQNDNGEKLLNSIEGLRGDVNGLKEGLNGLNERVLKLEEQNLKGE